MKRRNTRGYRRETQVWGKRWKYIGKKQKKREKESFTGEALIKKRRGNDRKVKEEGIYRRNTGKEKLME